MLLGEGILFVVGYSVAIVVLLRSNSVLRQRRWFWFVALEIATAMVATAYLMLKSGLGVALNVTLLAVFAVVWRRTGQGRDVEGQ